MIKDKESIGEKFIYGILILWISTEVLFNSNIERVFGVDVQTANGTMAAITLVMLVIQILFFQSYSITELFRVIAISAPIVIATILSGNNLLMSTWLFVIASKHMNFERSIQYLYFTQIVMLMIVLYAFFTGSIKECTYYRGTILRHSLGFTHPNLLGVRVFEICACRFYLKRENPRFGDILVTAVCAVLVYMVTNSQTATISLVMLLGFSVINLVMNYRKKSIELFARAMIWLSVLPALVSVVLSIIDVKKNSLLCQFDKFMSYRFSGCHSMIHFFGVKLLGQDIQLKIKRHIIGWYYQFWLDNAYMSILLRYGVIVFVIFMTLYIMTMILLYKSAQYELIEILGLYAIYGIMENNFFSLSQNLFLLLLSIAIYHEKISSLVIPLKRRVIIRW